MDEGLNIRLAPIHEVDLEPVADLVNRAFRRYRDVWIGERTSPEDYLDEAGTEARIMLVESRGKLVATSMVAPAERFIAPGLLGPKGVDRKAARPEPAGDHPWVGALYYGFAGVDPDVMNKGLGRTMIEYTERLAREESHAAIALATVREFGLVEYYERFAYRVVHEEQFESGHWDFIVPHRYCHMVKHL